MHRSPQPGDPGHEQSAAVVEVCGKEVDLWYEPHHLMNGQKILVVDGPFLGDRKTPGEVIHPNVVVNREKREVQGDGPAEHPTPNHPGQLVQERVAGAPPAEDLEGHERVCVYHDTAAGWYKKQSLKIVRSSFRAMSA